MKKKPDSVAHGRAMEKGGRDKTPPKVLHHLEIHPDLGGGVRVEHHHTASFEHPAEIHEFGKGDAFKFHSHLAEHTGMATEDDAETGKESAEIEEKVPEQV